MYRVFISYSRSDNFFAFNMKDFLAVDGQVDVFIDKCSMETGASVIETILSELKRTDELIVLLTPNSIRSAWIPFEAGIAFGHGIAVSPVRYNLHHGEVPEPFRHLNSCALEEFNGKLLPELLSRASVDEIETNVGYDVTGARIGQSSEAGPQPHASTAQEPADLDALCETAGIPEASEAWLKPTLKGLLSPELWERRTMQEAVTFEYSRKMIDLLGTLLVYLREKTDWRVRGEAHYCTGFFKLTDAENILLKGLSDPHVFVQGCCANGLEFVGTEKAIHALQAVLDSVQGVRGAQVVRFYARRTLDRLRRRRRD